MLDPAASVPRDDGGFYDDGGSSSDDEASMGRTVEDRKGRTLAAAFGAIMDKPQKAQAGSVPIRVGAKHNAEREAAEEEDMELKQQKKMRREMKKRGHMKVPRRGQNPAHDAREKGLQKLATKGVVRLFNAVSKAQQQQRDAAMLGKHKVQQSKADFFQELRGDASGASNMNDKVGKLMAKASGSKADTPGWSVLRDDFDLQGGTKMRDWDKEQEEEGGMPDEQLDGVDSDAADSSAIEEEEEYEEEEEEEELE